MKALLLVCLLASALADNGPPATLVSTDKSAPEGLNEKVFHLVTMSYSPQSGRHSMIRVVLANPISGCSTYPEIDDNSSYPVYYLVQGREGECTYSRKVFWAKQALAKGIIIIDSQKGTNNLNLRLNRQNFQIFLMPEYQGDSLVRALTEKGSFIAKLNIGGNREDQSNAEIWISSLNRKSYQVLGWWQMALANTPAMAQKIRWRPRFAFTACKGESCGGEFVSSCACAGFFCSPETHMKSSNVLVREDIRQILVFKDHPAQFLDYMRLFKEKCLEKYIASNYAQDCAGGVLETLDIEAAPLNQRIDNFLGTCGGNEQSKIIYQQMTMDKAKMSRINHYPVIFVNFQQIMTTSEKEMKASLCHKMGFNNEAGCSQEVTVNEVMSKMVSVFFWLVAVVVLVGTGVLVVVYFRGRLKRQMNKQLKMQVSTAVEHYFQLSDSTISK